MNKKIILMLGLVLSSAILFIVFGERGSSEKKRNQMISDRSESKGSPQKSNRSTAPDTKNSSRKSESPNREYHSPRIVDFSVLSSDLISQVKETITPLEVISSDFERNQVTSNYKEVMGALSHLINKPFMSKYPHSYCEGEDFFLIWGTHTNSPERGLAVRKTDGKLMAWDVNNDHIWEGDGDDRRVTTAHKMAIGYFFEKEDWEEFRARRDAEEERLAAAWKEHVKKRAAEQRRKDLEKQAAGERAQ